MKRSTLLSWLKPFQSRSRSGSNQHHARSRKLGAEMLEDRKMLTTLFVTNADDLGPDTFRAAISAANNDSSVDAIVFDGVAAVDLDSEVEYTGEQALSIDGAGATISASSAGANDLLLSSGGADLSLANLTFEDGANGVLVPVPEDAQGTVAVSLDNVTLQNNARYGLHLTDQVNDSDASVRLDIANSTIMGNGRGDGVTDIDGVRVDDGGKGSITANVSNSHFDDNGADGLEVDESGPGDIRLNISDSTFNDNGDQDPDDLEDGIDVDEAGAGSVWANIVDSTFNGNRDEGIDLDEEMDGNMHITLLRVSANNNDDEGIKINEKYAEDNDGETIPGSSKGNLFVSFVDVTANGSVGEEGISISEEGRGNSTAILHNVIANGNTKEGIDLSEEGTGNLLANLRNVTASDNSDDGIQIEEAGRGNLSVIAKDVTAIGNDSDKHGLKVEQADQGNGTLVLGDADLDDLDTDGVIVTEV